MKRLLCLILAAVLLLGVAAVGASADEVLTASDEAIRILKLEEGFSSTPYWDYAQWTVGYGTKCPDDKLEEYRKNGISEEDAEALLRTHIARFESELYAFMIRSGAKLNQNQFDALLLFSYNCGSAWAYDTQGVTYNAIASGATGNELIDALVRWCNAGGQIKTFLLRRRMCEANIYLNGVYSQTAPQEFGYVLYDACGGVSKPNVQGYHVELTAKVNPVPTYEGYTFEGWYTAKTGGTKVEVLDASLRNGRVYAHWKDGEGNSVAEPEEEGVSVTVTANGVNIRKGAGTNHPVVGTANTGDQMVITETAEGSGYTWGKFKNGWICLQFTNYDLVAAPKPEEPVTPTTKMGTVKVNDYLNVRSGPSTGYSIVARLGKGDRVEILEEKISGSMVWGKISKGWISMDYVVIDEVTEPPKTEENPPVEETEPPVQETEPPVQETEPPVQETEPPVEETQPETKPQEPEKPSESTEDTSVNLTGTIKVNDFLRVRSGPSTATAIVGYLKPNQKVTITEQTTSGSTTWGKIDSGWISMDYVELDRSSSNQTQTVTGIVKVNDFLRVRSGPSTSYAISAYLKPNEKVEITEQKTVNGTRWGKISKGWISMDYVVITGSNTQSGGNTQTGGNTTTTTTTTKTVTADCLRVRKNPGTSNTIVAYLYRGAKVEILETKTVDGVQWGRISKGWISMDYVK